MGFVGTAIILYSIKSLEPYKFCQVTTEFKMSQLLAPNHEELRAEMLGKVVIVTGGAQGIGFAISEMFAISGANVVIADLDEELGRKTAKTIGRGASSTKCDVTSWTDQVKLFEDTVRRYGRLDLVVCNAGIDPELTLSMCLDGPELASAKSQVKYNFLADEYVEGSSGSLRPPTTTVMDVNFTGVVYNLKLAIHHMRRRGGKIVVIGSAAGYISEPVQSLYCASKHAVLGLVRATSRKAECIENDISIAMVAPWLTDTPMTSNLWPRLTEGQPTSSARDVAAAVSIIATQPAEIINGKSIWVQGQIYTEVETSIAECLDKLIFHS